MTVLVGQKYKYKYHKLLKFLLIVVVEKITYLPHINDEEITVRATEATGRTDTEVGDIYGVTHESLIRDYVLIEDTEEVI